MNVPRLRFKEFSGDWEEKKLYEISDIKTGPFGSTLHQADYALSGSPIITVEHLGEQGVIHQNLPLVSDDDKSRLKSYHLKEGDVIFSRVGSVDRSCLISSKENGWLFSGRLLRVRLTNYNFSSKFLNQNLKNDSVKYRIRSVAVGQTMASLNTEILKNFHLSFPPSFPEQNKIANFLTAVDEKITQLTQKGELLTRYKKGVMQQIFSQQLRFKDDDGQDFPEWDETTLGEISSIKRGASPRPIADKKWFCNDSKIGWVRISDVSRSDKFLNCTQQYLSNEGIGKSRLVTKGNIIMSICATIGKPIYTNFDVCIHDGFVVFEQLQINHEFLYYYLMLIEKNWYQYGQPGSQVNLNSDIVSNESISIPDSKEQTKIANFLTALDDKIKHNQTQLDAVKQYKQGLLQQLFV